MAQPQERRTPLPHIALIALVFAACAPIAFAQERGACVSSNVPEAFTLPDGSMHAAGRLTLCTVQAFSPVVGLHRMWPEGGGASLVMSRRARAETKPDSRPVLLFNCAPGEPLDLVGYVLSDGRRSWSYSLRHSNPSGFAKPAASRVPPSGDASVNSLP
jgi:hypothetical protein